jgi:hypothetical protein
MRDEQSVRGAAAQAVQDRKHAQKMQRWPLFVLAPIVIIILLLNVTVGSTPRIVFGGNKSGDVFLRDKKAYTEAAKELLSGSFSNTNKVTINTRELERKFNERFPELAGTTITLPLVGRQPDIYLTPRVPALILAASGGSAYIVDTTGRALITVDQVPNLTDLGLPIVADQSGLRIEAGKAALPSDNVAFITEVVGQLAAKKIDIVGMSLPEAASELQVKPRGVGYFVKFNLRGDARAEAGAYLAVKGQLERENKVPSSYIDVRVDGRAYYK